MIRTDILVLFVVCNTVAVLAFNCGPKANNTVCRDGNCCSSFGWCGQTDRHCDVSTCLKAFSDPKSKCNAVSSINVPPPASAAPSGPTAAPIAAPRSPLIPVGAVVPNIDTCGRSDGRTCPGAGQGGYFYRCCSAYGHCGPKNDIQDQSIYCGDGCQAGFGLCNPNATVPLHPVDPPRTVGMGENCGPIVNARCEKGLCCSGSNFCGRGEDYCGSKNWCQKNYGDCD